VCVTLFFPTPTSGYGAAPPLPTEGGGVAAVVPRSSTLVSHSFTRIIVAALHHTPHNTMHTTRQTKQRSPAFCFIVKMTTHSQINQNKLKSRYVAFKDISAYVYAALHNGDYANFCGKILIRIVLFNAQSKQMHFRHTP
jgi:hypothetical protein